MVANLILDDSPGDAIAGHEVRVWAGHCQSGVSIERAARDDDLVYLWDECLR